MSPIPAAEKVTEWRRAIGAGTRLWATRGLETAEGGWVALSGAPVADYNVVAVHQHDPDFLDASLQKLGGLGCPGVVMLAGGGLGVATDLADRGWVCVAAMPLMVVPAFAWVPRPPSRGAVRCAPITRDDRAKAVDVIGRAYNVPSGQEVWAIPTGSGADDGIEVFGVWDGDELVSVLGGVTTEGTFVGWSMATPPELQRRGYGARLLDWMGERKLAEGVHTLACLSAPPGVRAYLAVGGRIVEHWQVWSRPRWIMAG